MEHSRNLPQKAFGLIQTKSASKSHDDRFNDKLVEDFPEVETIVADSAYKTLHIAKKIFDDGRISSTVYKRPMSKQGFFKPYEYVYDKYFDCCICPNNAPLKYNTTNRDGYREYKSDPNICKNCK